MRKIKPINIIDATDGQLAICSGITGKDIFAQNLPFLGRVVCFDGKRHCGKSADEMPSNEFFETSLEQRNDSKEVVRLYVGSKKHGPILQIDVNEDGCEWRNIYSKGNFGKNYSCGGNWYGQKGSISFDCWQDALKSRYDSKLSVLSLDMVKFTESVFFINELDRFLHEYV